MKRYFVVLLLVILTAACSGSGLSAPAVAEATQTAVPPTPANPAPGTSGLGDAYFPELGNAGYDVLHYSIELDVDMGLNEIAGSTTINAVTTQDLSSLNLEFFGLEIEEISVNQAEALFSREGLELTVFLPTPISAGQSFTLSVRYHGTPGEGLDTTELADYEIGWGYYGDGVYVAGEPTGSSSWYPVNEHPSDKATYSFQITVQEPFVVAANGLLLEVLQGDGDRTYVWESQYPIASYLVTLGIAEFDIEEEEGPNGLPIRNYFGVGVSNFVRQDFARTVEMIEVFEVLFGPYPFEAYGVVVHDLDLRFALETQTLSVFGRSFTNEEVVSHELAHQWFGDSVTLSSWQDIWLNEGFATYASVLWTEHSRSQAAAEDALGELYGDMAPGQVVYQLTRGELSRGLQNLMPAGESYLTQPLEAALRILLQNALSEEELDEMAADIPEEGLDINGLANFVDDQAFTRISLPSSHLSNFFRQLNLFDLSAEFANFYPPPGDPSREDLFSRSVYQRGALALHALRLEIGDETFFDLLRAFSKEYENSNASTADFIALAEEISGQELDELFDAWLYQQPIPDMPELGLFREDFAE